MRQLFLLSIAWGLEVQETICVEISEPFFKGDSAGKLFEINPTHAGYPNQMDRDLEINISYK